MIRQCKQSNATNGLIFFCLRVDVRRYSGVKDETMKKD